MSDYVPIDCDFYDRLEAAAVQRRSVEVCFQPPGEAEKRILARVMTLETRQREEWLVLDNGQRLRLDWLTRFDGHVRPL